MKPIPQNILGGFNALMKQRNVPPMLLGDYRKWLLYFLDFRAKYPFPASASDQVRLFTEKLRSKHQTADQVEQATDALSLFFASTPGSTVDVSLNTAAAPAAPLFGRRCEGKDHADRNPVCANTALPMVCEPPGGPLFAPPERSGRRYDEWRCLRKTEAPAWDAVIEKLAAEIQVRHYLSSKMKRLRASILRVYSFSYPLAPLTPEFAKNTQALRRLGPQVPELP